MPAEMPVVMPAEMLAVMPAEIPAEMAAVMPAEMQAAVVMYFLKRKSHTLTSHGQPLLSMTI